MSRRQKWVLVWLAIFMGAWVSTVRAETLTLDEAELRIEQQARDVFHVKRQLMRGWKTDQVAATTSMALDWYSTVRGLDRCETCYEGNPLYSWADRDTTQLAAAMITTRFLLGWWQRHSYRKGYPSWARALAVVEMSSHMLAVGLNEAHD